MRKRLKVAFILGMLLVPLCTGSRVFADDCKGAVDRLARGVEEGSGSKKAEELFAEAIRLCPSMPDAHFRLGSNLVEQGRFREALSSLQEALRLERDRNTLLLLANVYVLTEDLRRAEEYYGAILEKDDADVGALQGLSVVELSRGNAEKSEELLRRAVQSEPDAGSLYYNLGLVLQRLGRDAEALASFRTAVEKDGSSVRPLVQLARASLESDELEEAEVFARRAVERFPGDLSSWLVLAAVEERRGALTEADKALERAAEIDPKRMEVLVNRAVVRAKLDKADDAESGLKTALDLYPGEALVHSCLGWLYLRQGRLEEAQKHLDTAAGLDSNEVYAQNNLGVLYELKGERGKAEQAFARASEIDSGVREVAENLKRLKE